jgi:hypothetical protein
MLVYHSNPLGYLQIEGYRIYGKKYAYGSFGPTDIPRDLYKKHKDILVDAVYTKEWLDRKFSKNFPAISFDISFNISDADLKTIAELVGIKVSYGKRHELTTIERNALRRSILLKMSD